MSHDFRAAIAAFAAMALCACATTNNQNETETEDLAVSIIAPVVQSASSSAAPAVVNESSNTLANETLLYGAMTKYELMSFVEAVGNANLQSALEADGPITVFAPNSQAFEYARLGANADLGSILKGHIVSGAMDVAALQAAVADNGGPMTLMSAAGTELTVYIMDGTVKISGPTGNLATVTQGDMIQSNGVMHQINSVLSPE